MPEDSQQDPSALDHRRAVSRHFREAWEHLRDGSSLQSAEGPRFAQFRWADVDYWQGVAGGGEADESPVQAAWRETADEAGLVGNHDFVALDARATIPVVYVTGEFTWGCDVLEIPEYAFGVRAHAAERPAITR